MNTVVWIMVMFGYGDGIVTGPEFKTRELCEKAAVSIKTEADTRSAVGFGNRHTPFCVRVEK